jgi:hypothetical protein
LIAPSLFKRVGGIYLLVLLLRLLIPRILLLTISSATAHTFKTKKPVRRQALRVYWTGGI